MLHSVTRKRVLPVAGMAASGVADPAVVSDGAGSCSSLCALNCAACAGAAGSGLPGERSIGVAAGGSTPDWLINDLTEKLKTL